MQRAYPVNMHITNQQVYIRKYPTHLNNFDSQGKKLKKKLVTNKLYEEDLNKIKNTECIFWIAGNINFYLEILIFFN